MITDKSSDSHVFVVEELLFEVTSCLTLLFWLIYWRMCWSLCCPLFDIWRLYKKRREIIYMLYAVQNKSEDRRDYITIRFSLLLFFIFQIKKIPKLSCRTSFSNNVYLLLGWICMYRVNKSAVLYCTTSLFVLIHLFYSLKREQVINTSVMVQSHVSTGRHSAFVFSILSWLVFRAWRTMWCKGIGLLFYWLTQPFNSAPSRHQRL